MCAVPLSAWLLCDADMDGALIAAAVAAIICPLSVLRARRKVQGTMPVGIVSRIGRPGSRHIVRIRGMFARGEGTWNPAKPFEPRHYLYGPGVATYWLDDQQQVNLDWRPKRGSPQRFVGPIPAQSMQPKARNPRSRRVAALIWSTYLIFATGGFVLGLELATGSTQHRLVIGLFSAIAAYFAAYVVMLALLATNRARLVRWLAAGRPNDEP